jgi:integrase
MSKAKVVLTARVNDGTGKFPFVGVEVRRNAIKLPVEHEGKVYEPDSILGFYARYPHTPGNCLFPGCTGGVARHVESLGKDHVEAYSKYQRIDRDFSRVRDGKLPLEENKPAAKGQTIEEAVAQFETEQAQKQRKSRTIESYAGSLKHFLTYCGEVGLRAINQIDRKAMLGFVGWMEKNLQRRSVGHPNNTYRNKLKDLRAFLNDIGHGMPLKGKDWPKRVKARKEKYSVAAVKEMLNAVEMERHPNNAWEPDDDKDLIHFLMKTGFRDEEIQHAQYSDINFRNATVNVTAKPKGSFPGHPELTWTPKDNEAREKDIVVDDAFLKRMKERKERYNAKSNSLIFPNSKGKPNAHLIRVIQRLAKEAGIEGRIGLHKFRKTFATMVAREEGIEQARILLGHEDIATTQDYLASDEIAPEQDRKMVKKRFEAFGD